ncbi:glycosyltransferase [Rhodospirillum rubrum]|uniref:Glycosyl transferase, group 1 n=1 Tax=Rhodospirillum rubrum (strain ATCC 11170 / ATH 1.1.1 / DSM 467 / LMG 4362 / NCIMB 8255 / S1) TaxID=269796 RepID=Q2RWV8_RHORT|nr:glycosyltransferase [Rhodospirillum rubrum]ABC21387.1 Glycosyl transferase, group 1 [Rhodospirillum rubrum ATCC 11170]AEO47067.1 glycosyl transferase, group 1 [Rhodospirillum rubrum F11]MBK5952980.1 glycosyl transferase family 1 [Rhodospirillum rubrum]QXG81065.1 glycosyltransferase [Rhodospirillum rubrum]HAP98518.1 glycosyl transferase family 1 [Rhodospirillum rubrum]
MIKVAVLVTLPWTADAGGHVKVWERFAEAAEPFADRASLTVYFLGPTDQTVVRNRAARFRLLPARLGTDRIPLLSQGAGHTDLSGFLPRLGGELTDYDVVMSTDVFSFGRTAERVCASAGIPLVHSVHTDVVHFTEIYGPRIVTRALGQRLGGWIVKHYHLGRRFAGGIERRLHQHWAACRHIIVSRPLDAERVHKVCPEMPVSFLRRGVDTKRFDPALRDRLWLERAHGVPPSRKLLVFAGRVDASKRAMVAVRAARTLIEAGHDVGLLLAGTGEDLEPARALLGPRLVAPGVVPQDDLARLMACGDLFVFPSVSETAGNVVLEALASGLPVVVSGRPGGCAGFVGADGANGRVVDDRGGNVVEAWRRALVEVLSGDGEAKRRAARASVEGTRHLWTDIYEHDLLDVWEAVAGGRRDVRVDRERVSA